ncbi:MAG: T9SS type A sorting domain-containing protein [Bacteroidota bacterium]
MKYIFTLLFATTIMFASYSQVEKTVIVEHFTNTKCGICALRNPAFYEVLNDYPNVLHIAYHPSSPYPTCLFNLHNIAENDARTNYYGVYGATPQVVLQGDVIGIQSPMIRPDQIESFLGQESDFSISIQHILTENTIEITIIIERVSGDGAEDMLFYVALVEKEVAYNAPNGENLHHDVFRLVIYEQPVSLPVTGSTVTIVKTIDINSDWIPEEMAAIGILHNPTSKEIIQSAESTNSTSFLESNTHEVIALIYPNPVKNRLYIKSNEIDRFVSADVYSLLGKKLIQFTDVHNMDISNLSSGIYFVALKDEKGNISTSKITKSY